MLGYRQWARDLFHLVTGNHHIEQVAFSEQFNHVADGADIYFLIGWSEIVPLEFYEDRLVLVLHPSPLPKYRGGSPIQHQIISGETMSAVTLFKLDPAYPAVDSGPIYGALLYSLEGSLSDVLNRIATVGARLVTRAIEDFEMGALTFTPQDESQATTFKRRKPEESQIPFEAFNSELYATGLAVHNRVRALQDPYPNTYVEFEDGRLYITQTRWEPK
jgi:methionyl-tRNA formyltransferase